MLTEIIQNLVTVIFSTENLTSSKKHTKKLTSIDSVFAKLTAHNGITLLRYANDLKIECNPTNLFLIANFLLAHKLKRSDLIASPKTLMYEMYGIAC